MMLSKSIYNAGRSRTLSSSLRSFSSTTAVKSDYDIVVVGKSICGHDQSIISFTPGT